MKLFSIRTPKEKEIVKDMNKEHSVKMIELA